MTNAEKIRALSDKELADILTRCCIGSGCEDCPAEEFCGQYRGYEEWLAWLESEAEEE